MRIAIAAIAALAGGVAASASASALPLPKSGAAEAQSSLVEQVAHWRYHRNCNWRNGRWVVDLGIGRIVACRPMRPGRDYRWHRERDREGWWNPRTRSWHDRRR